jgi:polyisoprenoid-binding protein YceI
MKSIFRIFAIVAFSFVLGLVGLGLAGPVEAQSIDTAKSRITITFKQMNVPVDAAFKRFNAKLNFDPAKPAEARALVEIDMASFDFGPGAEEYSAEVQKKEWFDTKQFPQATFAAGAGLKVVGENKFEAPGILTIKGKTQNIVAPLVAKTEAGATVFEGQLAIKRLAFNIGEGEWKDTDTVADEVVIKFRIVAKP